MKKYVIGMDLGGTKITTAISDFEGNIIEKTTIPTMSREGSLSVMTRMIQSIDNVLEMASINISEVKAIGIGSPGPLDANKGEIIQTPNLPFKNFNIVKPIEEKFNVPVFLDNDANVASVGEFMFGRGKGFENVIYMTVSTGVGAGAVLNKKPYRGTSSNALEIGHMTVNPFSKKQCNCGNFGDVEALASGTAISKSAKELIDSGRDSILKDYEMITPYEVYDAYKKGDNVAIEVLDEAFMYLGIAVANLILTFNPQVIAIGGGVSKIGDLFFEKIREEASKRCFKTMFENVKIVPTGLEQDTGVLGAIALAIVESE